MECWKLKFNISIARYENISLISGHLIMVPKKFFCLKYSLLVFLSDQLEIVNTWPGKYGGTRAQRTHHLGLQSMLGRDLTSNTF